MKNKAQFLITLLVFVISIIVLRYMFCPKRCDFMPGSGSAQEWKSNSLVILLSCLGQTEITQ